MERLMLLVVLCVGLGMSPTTARASIIFRFHEVGGAVVITSSGTLDTTKLVPSLLPVIWVGTGHNTSDTGEPDIMGGTSFGQPNTAFGFHPGTDTSAITNPGGPFWLANF